MAPDNDWSTPKAIAIPKEGYFTLQQGRYGPTYPRTPACHGFTIIAKIKPGTEDEIRAYGARIEKTIEASPHALAPLQLHYLRWVLFDIGSDKYFMYQGIFDTDFDKYTEDADRAVQGDRRQHDLREARRISDRLEDERSGLHQVRPRTPVSQLPRIRRISRTSLPPKSRRRSRSSRRSRPCSTRCSRASMSQQLDLEDIQHFLLTRTPALAARYEFLNFENAGAGRAWLAGLVDKVGTGQSVGTASPDARWVTIAFTYDGLRALGVERRSARDVPRRSSARAWPPERRFSASSATSIRTAGSAISPLRHFTRL